MRRSGVVVTLAAAFVAALSLAIPPVASACWTTTKLTVDAHDHGNPQVSGNRVVWQGSDGTNEQIFTRLLGVDGSAVQLSDDTNDSGDPQVSGDRVVWQSFVGGLSQVFTEKVGVDLSPVQLAAGTHGDGSPQVSGDRVVWWDGSDSGVSNWYVFAQEVGGGAAAQLSGDGDNAYDPQVDGARVVWADANGISTQEIGVDVAPVAVVTSSYSQDIPQVSGDRVVWDGFDGFHHQVYTREIGVDATPLKLTDDQNDGFCWPQVSGERVVWQSFVGGHLQIFTQKMGTDATPVQLTSDSHDHSNPQVSGDRVVWQGSDGTHEQIFTEKVGVDSSPDQITTDAHDHSNPQVSGDRIVWQGSDGTHDQIFTAVPAVRCAVKVTKSPTGSRYTLRRKRGIARWKFTGIFKTSGGAVITGKSVVLQRSTNGKAWKRAYRLTTNSYGKAVKKLIFKKKGTTSWRWYSASSSTYQPAAGKKTKIVVR